MKLFVGVTDTTEMLFGKNSVTSTSVAVSSPVFFSVTVYVSICPTFGWISEVTFSTDKSAYFGVSVTSPRLFSGSGSCSSTFVTSATFVWAGGIVNAVVRDGARTRASMVSVCVFRAPTSIVPTVQIPVPLS